MRKYKIFVMALEVMSDPVTIRQNLDPCCKIYRLFRRACSCLSTILINERTTRCRCSYELSMKVTFSVSGIGLDEFLDPCEELYCQLFKYKACWDLHAR